MKALFLTICLIAPVAILPKSEMYFGYIVSAIFIQTAIAFVIIANKNL